MNARGRGRIRLLGFSVVAAWLVLGLPLVATADGQAFTFSATQGHVGDPVHLHGTGWIASDGDIQIFFIPEDESLDAEYWDKAPVGAGGTFDVDTNIPPVPWGQQKFYACQSCDAAGDAPPQDTEFFTVLAAVHFDQSHGSPGDTVGVFGDGWSPNSGPVKVFASREESNDETNILTTLKPDSHGTLAAGGSLHVPDRDPGPKVFFACQLCPEKPEGPSAEARFEITEVSAPVRTQTLTLDRKSAAPGDDITASGTGWSDTAGDVSVYADEAAMREGADPLGGAPSIGQAFSTPVTVPQTDASTLVMFACQHCGESELEATFSLKVDPGVVLDAKLTISPSSGRVGSEVRVIGTGWEDEPVGLFMRLPGAKTGTKLGPVPTEGGGFDEKFRVPSLRIGPVVIVGCQECGQGGPAYRAAFTVVGAAQDPPTLVVDPTSAKPGDDVTVSGAGWLPADGEVTVYVDPVATSDPTSVWFHVTPRRDGTISSDAPLPDSDAGDYRVYACQRCGATVSFPYQTAALEIEAGGGRGLGGLVGVIVVGAVVIWWIFVHDSSPKGTSGGSSTSSPTGPHVVALPDHTLDVEVRPDPGPADSHVSFGFDVVPVPDTAQLADRVEVTP